MKSIEKFIDVNDKDLFTLIGADSDQKSERISTAPYSYWKSAFRQFFKNKIVTLCLAIIVILILLTIFGPMINYKDVYNYNDLANAYRYPSAEHWFGTNSLGKDIWSLVWIGARTSLLLALVVSLINITLGLVIGSLWGFFRRLDPILIEFKNFVYNVPSLLINILLLTAFKSLATPLPEFWSIVIVLCMFGWVGLASTLRNQIIIIRNRDYNLASETLGSKSGSIILHNLLPYLVSIIITVISNIVPAVIESEISLSFFGLGFDYMKQISLGYVVDQATKAGSDWNVYPHVMLIPSTVMILITLSFYFLGLKFADATDPKNHR